MTITFEIAKVAGTFTAVDNGLRNAQHRAIRTGSVSWDSLKVNGKTYGRGGADIIYGTLGMVGPRFMVDFDFMTMEELTDSAKQIISEGILEALESSELMQVPTVSEINAELLEDAYRAGTRFGASIDRPSSSDGLDSVIANWSTAYEILLGKSGGHPARLPVGPGVVDLGLVKAEFLAAAQVAITKELEAVEAAL